jgi:hypothetical protein
MAESIHADRKRRRAEHFGFADDEPVEEPAEQEDESLSMLNTKAELLEAAEEAGVEVDESATKAEILEALEAD